MSHFERTLPAETVLRGQGVHRHPRPGGAGKQPDLGAGDRAPSRRACVAALTGQDEVYLVRQFRFAFGEELWELPAGKLEPGEDPSRPPSGSWARSAVSSPAATPTWGLLSHGGLLQRGHLHLACHRSFPLRHAPGRRRVPHPRKGPFETAVDMVFTGEIKDGKTIAALLKIKTLREREKAAE